MKSEQNTQPPKARLYCNRCNGDTHHENVWHGAREEDLYAIGDTGEDGPFLQETTVYKLWKCLGCESVLLQERSGIEQSDDWEIHYHPKRNRHGVKAKYFNKLPQRLSTIYKEAVTCFNSESWTLCAVGLRALIEGICTEKDISGRNIEKKIDGLMKILPENIVTNLHSLRFMGNKAAHELEPPSGYDLTIALEVCEDLLNYLYELDYKTSRLAHLKKIHQPVTNAPEPEK